MSKTGRTNYRRGSRGVAKAERQIVVRGVRRDQPDLRKLSRAVIAMALRDAEMKADIDQALTGTHIDQSTPSKPDAVEPADE
ncbi:hypothetical protein [Gordonia aichiensis]|uniref:Uncharacterized protein n=1 Tax=Gordonia aichiensis NBRC 108223 TaxID=1220583 RepID=L7KR87_9ACTN|nr:hypothetical protein [Gordonia aichiensis]GAC50996.1 hypothetical protein GOACH_36_00180 [Gordonia aichiensis NBRC 108223]